MFPTLGAWEDYKVTLGCSSHIVTYRCKYSLVREEVPEKFAVAVTLSCTVSG